LYVGGLSYSTTDESLKNLFAQTGPVESARVMMDRDTGKSRGFGFVEMSSASDAARAINTLNGVELDGRNIVVNEAKPVTDRRSGGGGYGRNRY
jgi:RNA recognition motif-containing protein